MTTQEQAKIEANAAFDRAFEKQRQEFKSLLVEVKSLVKNELYPLTSERLCTVIDDLADARLDINMNE